MVGAVALITIVVFIFLFNFLKGTEFFSSSDTYHIIYNEISGLEESSPVEINGYKAGIVQDIKFINDGTGRLAVSITVKKEFDLPLGTAAEITTASLIAGMKIKLIMGESKEFYHNHDTIEGYVAPSIIDKLAGSIAPLEDNIADIIITLDSVISSLNSLITPELTANIQSAVANVNGITANFREISAKEKEKLIGSIEDLNKFTTMLSSNSASFDSTIKNIGAISDTIASADLGTSLSSLKSTLSSMDSVLKNISTGEGTAGKLVTDDSLYVNLSNSLNSLDLLLRDMKDNPKKYVHFSLFGKKDK